MLLIRRKPVTVIDFFLIFDKLIYFKTYKMKKKLLFLSSAVLAFTLISNAQSSKQGTKVNTKGVTGANTPIVYKTTVVPDSVTTNDTLHYYLNKVFYKAGTTVLNNFPKYKNAAATVTNVTHCGSRFDVPIGDSIRVTGLEAFVQKGNFFAPSTSVKVHLYLCKLDANGLPLNPAVTPPIDSIITSVGGAYTLNPGRIGGDFGDTAYTMKESFAVLFRNMSTYSGDTIYLLRTDGASQNSAADIKYKYSDDEGGKPYGFVRFLGNMYGTKDFTLAPGFGAGTQYEFIVAPRVRYFIQASHQVDINQGVYTADDLPPYNFQCTRTLLTFTNTSSKFYEHRMYNLNPFYLKWALGSGFQAAPPGGFSADSAITWSFEFYDQATPAKDSRVFLPYVNNGTISAESDISFYPDCFTANEMRARLRPMNAFNTAPQLVANILFTVCAEWCNGDTVGIKKYDPLASIRVYPNPAENGMTTISGLSGKNSIIVFNMIGQAILSEETNRTDFEIDLSSFPKGTYLIRIVNDANESKTIKVVR